MCARKCLWTCTQQARWFSANVFALHTPQNINYNSGFTVTQQQQKKFKAEPSNNNLESRGQFKMCFSCRVCGKTGVPAVTQAPASSGDNESGCGVRDLGNDEPGFTYPTYVIFRVEMECSAVRNKATGGRDWVGFIGRFCCVWSMMLHKNTLAISQHFGAQRGPWCYTKMALGYHKILVLNVFYHGTQK